MTDFEIWHDKGVALIEPSGVLDGEAVPHLRTALVDAAKLTRLALIVILDDMITRVDAVALAALLIEHRRLRDRGGSLAVVGMQGPIAELLRRTCLGDDVPLFADLDQALTDLTAPRPEQ